MAFCNSCSERQWEFTRIEPARSGLSVANPHSNIGSLMRERLNCSKTTPEPNYPGSMFHLNYLLFEYPRTCKHIGRGGEPFAQQPTSHQTDDLQR